MSQPQPATDGTRFRVADDTSDPDSETHLISEHRTATLCGDPVGDPQVIGGTTQLDHLPTIKDAEHGDICTSCVHRARNQNNQ